MNDSSRSDEFGPEQWLDEHGNILYKFAVLRVNDPHVAEDLVQETLIKAFANLDKFRNESTIRTWLFAIMRNEISGYFRQKQKENSARTQSNRKEDLIQLDQLLCPKLTNEQFSTAVEREEFWDLVQICFEQVPEHLLETFLHRLANPDVKIETLCQELGVKPSNFSVRLFRTRLMLRQCLERSWMKE